MSLRCKMLLDKGTARNEAAIEGSIRGMAPGQRADPMWAAVSKARQGLERLSVGNTGASAESGWSCGFPSSVPSLQRASMELLTCGALP
ncbi:hypothetical protein AAL_00120 [Moelleriella libera RCEF 2490]|uniref:Uncharacterized protein n=1 Tax=Moelleriella libera RCEF 2490 TaxID=1081109 RepID=A0A166RM21_9HYPO|nr:hypothetical protein AAL_00120 [Moelleriella libera RCEF 2490]